MNKGDLFFFCSLDGSAVTVPTISKGTSMSVCQAVSDQDPRNIMKGSNNYVLSTLFCVLY